ncbi:hypothetical protein ABT215_36965 [Streptomyces sp900105755]|uniref:hypothetical protein n=1 Tax=Streptomyces sp. 900105755 TaxID=3154389 RepID=UPI00331C3384
MVPGWPYSVVAASEDRPHVSDGGAGRGPLGARSRCRRADHGVLVVQDAGYDAPRSAHRRRRRSGIGERSFAWLHGFRRLRIRWEGRAGIHEAFLKLARCHITDRQLRALRWHWNRWALHRCPWLMP